MKKIILSILALLAVLFGLAIFVMPAPVDQTLRTNIDLAIAQGLYLNAFELWFSDSKHFPILLSQIFVFYFLRFLALPLICGLVIFKFLQFRRRKPAEDLSTKTTSAITIPRQLLRQVKTHPILAVLAFGIAASIALFCLISRHPHIADLAGVISAHVSFLLYILPIALALLLAIRLGLYPSADQLRFMWRATQSASKKIDLKNAADNVSSFRISPLTAVAIAIFAPLAVTIIIFRIDALNTPSWGMVRHDHDSFTMLCLVFFPGLIALQFYPYNSVFGRIAATVLYAPGMILLLVIGGLVKLFSGPVPW